MIRIAVLVAVASFLALFLIAPVGGVLAGGMDPVFLREVFAHPTMRSGLANSFAIAAITTVLCVLIALPLAWLAVRYRFRGRGLCEGLLLAPLVLPPFVGALGLAQILGRTGALNAALAAIGVIEPGAGPDWLGEHRFAAVCMLEALHLYPFLYLTLATSFARLDPSLLDAAQGLGASAVARLRRIVLPLVLPGLFAGASVVFVWSFTELGTPLMLGYDRCTPVQVFMGLSDVRGGDLTPFALILVMLAVSALLYGGAQVIVRRHGVLAGKSGLGLDAAAQTLHGLRAFWVRALFAVVIACAVLPHAGVLLLAVARDWHGTVLPSALTMAHASAALAHPHVVPGIANSLLCAGLATVLALVVGVAIAWMSVRAKLPGWRLIDLVAMMPLAVPGVVMAFGYLALADLLCRMLPTLRPLIDPFSNPTILLIIAYAVRRLPYVVRAATAGFEQAPPMLEDAAASLGAGAWTRFRRITVPLIAGALAAGALLTFSFSMLEVSDSLILAQKREYWPITRVIYDLVNLLGTGPAVACAFAVWAMAFLAAALCTAAAIRGTSLTRLLRE